MDLTHGKRTGSQQFNLPTAGIGLTTLHPRMPTIDETKPAVNIDLLTVLRDAYFEGLGDGNTSGVPLNIELRQRCWLASHTCQNVPNIAVAIIRSQFEPRHHRLDPPYLTPEDFARIRQAEDADRFNQGHKPQDA